VVSHSFEFGGHRVGIRTTSEAFGAWIAETLAEYRTSEEAAPSYSVVVGEPSAGRNKNFHILYQQTLTIARTLDLGSLVRTLLSELEGVLLLERDDAIYADCRVVSYEGGTALVPSVVVPYVEEMGRRVERSGLAMPEETAVAIDPDTAELVPLTPRLRLREDALERLGRVVATNGHSVHREPDAPRKVDVVFSIAELDRPFEPISSGLALYRLASHVLNFDKTGGTALEGLARLIERAQTFALDSAAPKDMLEALTGAIGLVREARTPLSADVAG
jgi:hypothetical protein